MYTYSGTPATLNTELTAVQVHRLLQQPTVLAARFRDLVFEKFIADFLLTGRYNVTGGAIAYPADETDPYTKDNPEAIAPLAQYSLTQMDAGQLAIAKTAKRGHGSHISDEELSRLLINPVNDGFNALSNNLIRQVDQVALATIASRVTNTYASSPWNAAGAAGAEAVVNAVAFAKAQASNLKKGVNLDTIVLTETQYATAMTKLWSGGYFPREAANPLTSDQWPNVLGLTWVTSPNTPFTDPFLVDRQKLGGMADENIISPEFTRARDTNVELSSTRATVADRDGTLIRVRRVCVPVVTRPWAGVRITGTAVA